MAALRLLPGPAEDWGGTLQGDGMDSGPAEAVVQEIRSADGEAIACIKSNRTAKGGTPFIQTALDHY